MNAIGEKRKLSLNQLEKIRRKAYENTRLSKERAKIFHDKCINRKEFSLGQNVLLYDFRLHLFLGKLRPIGTGSFVIMKVFPYGAVKIKELTNYHTVKVNRHMLKEFLEMPNEEDVKCLIGQYDYICE